MKNMLKDLNDDEYFKGSEIKTEDGKRKKSFAFKEKMKMLMSAQAEDALLFLYQKDFTFLTVSDLRRTLNSAM